MTQHPNDMDGSTLGLARGIAEDAAHLVSTELKLAKAEVRENVASMIQPVVLIVVGALFGLGAFLTLLGALVGLMTPQLGEGVAALIVAAGAAVIAGILVMSALNSLKKAKLVPEKVGRSLQRDIATIKGYA